MASSKVMANASTTNTDLPRQPSLYSSLSTLLADLQNQNQSSDDPSQTPGSMTMDDLFKNIYSFPTPPPSTDPSAPFPVGASMSRQGSFVLPKEVANKSADEVWKEIVAGGGDQRRAAAAEGIEEMTLEDFLTKAGAVREEDVRGVGVGDPVQVGAAVGAYGVDVAIRNNNNSSNNYNNSEGQFQGFGNGVIVEGGRGRGKRRAIEQPPVDKATQQKQKRMIKNRESAARSRERKQAYTVELESLVTQLEEENARLLREEAEQKKERFKQLMENLIPVVEKRRPPRLLRRVNSVHW